MGRLPIIPSNVKVGRKPAYGTKGQGGSFARCDSREHLGDARHAGRGVWRYRHQPHVCNQGARRRQRRHRKRHGGVRARRALPCRVDGHAADDRQVRADLASRRQPRRRRYLCPVQPGQALWQVAHHPRYAGRRRAARRWHPHTCRYRDYGYRGSTHHPGGSCRAR